MEVQRPLCTALFGMKEITEHAGMSKGTVNKLIEKEGFPACKIGGTWTSDVVLIRKWIRGKIEEDVAQRAISAVADATHLAPLALQPAPQRKKASNSKRQPRW